MRRRGVLLAAVAVLASGCVWQPSVPPRPTPVPPREFAGTVTDRYTGSAVPDAQVELEGVDGVVFSDETGRFEATAIIGSTITVTAVDYDARRVAVPADGDVAVELRPNTVTGIVTDGGGEAIAGARVFVDGTQNSVETDARGRYRIAGVPEHGILVYKAAGYALADRDVAQEESAVIRVALEPFSARSLYAPSAVFEAPGRLASLLDLVDRTEINALVIDVKETDGRLYYATDLPEAVEVGAVREQPILDLQELLPMLEERGVYAIARMVVAKDNTLAAARPELAVQNAATGGPWRDNLGGVWLDPNKPGVWEYALAIAGDVADKGFDEVQLDYVRFLSDGPYEQADLVLPNYQSHRLPAMRRLFRMVEEEFDHRRAFLSADVFPISFILADDQGIGQRADVVTPYVDYLSPMMYPSHYAPGIFGYDEPNEYPYEIIDSSLERILPDVDGLPVRLRPWIQDFGYGPFRAYGAADVRAQMQALYDNGVDGWMIWNPSAEFTEAALGPPEDAAAAED